MLSECADLVGGRIRARQSLRIRRGACAETVVLKAEGGPASAPLPGLCQLALGESLLADNSVTAGVIQRLGASPDARRVVFEVNTRFSFVPSLFSVPSSEEGLFVVRANGRGLRRLRDPIRVPSWALLSGASVFVDARISFSPDGNRIVFPDLGVGPSGESAVQLFLFDLRDGSQRQVTRLPAVPISAARPIARHVNSPIFLDDSTIFFGSLSNVDGTNPAHERRPFTIGTDGSRLRAVPRPEVQPGGAGFAAFREALGVSARSLQVFNVFQPGTPANPIVPTDSILEAVVLQGRDLLQLTRLGRIDTDVQFLDERAGRVVFRASADPFGSNPRRNCQLFSVGVLGDGLRQLTHLTSSATTTAACIQFGGPWCTISDAVQDPVTRSVVFYSTCDPVDAGSRGAQVLALEPDGGRVQRLTRARGVVSSAAGAFIVELPGPFSYSGRSAQ